jgi:hypothetical protein
LKLWWQTNLNKNLNKFNKNLSKNVESQKFEEKIDEKFLTLWIKMKGCHSYKDLLGLGKFEGVG